MKLVKLYSIITFYLSTIVILVNLYDQNLNQIIQDKYYIIIGFLSIELIFIVQTFYQFIRKSIIPYSILNKQALLLFSLYYFFEFKGYYQLVIIGFTMVLFYFISINMKKNLVYYTKSVNYRLIISKQKLLNGLYVVYGIICYVLFYLSKENIQPYFEKIDEALYVSLMPYLIIILYLYTLQYDGKTDEMNTIKRYKKNKIKKLFIRNLIISSIVFILFFFE